MRTLSPLRTLHGQVLFEQLNTGRPAPNSSAGHASQTEGVICILSLNWQSFTKQAQIA